MNFRPQPLPTSAFRLYVKLYCKRKAAEHKGDNSLVGAAKSWLTLTESEKEQFYKKHKECQMKQVKKFADALKNVEPYLKEKPSKRKLATEDQTTIEIEINSSKKIEVKNDNQESYIEQVKSTVEECIPVPDIEDNFETETEPLEEPMDELDDLNSLQENIPEKRQPEPTPPTLKTGKDLFDMVKSMDENNLTWTSLSQKQKSRYQYAVLFLKRDYIKKYKAYLESLSPKELFDYYNNCDLLDF